MLFSYYKDPETHGKIQLDAEYDERTDAYLQSTNSNFRQSLIQNLVNQDSEGKIVFDKYLESEVSEITDNDQISKLQITMKESNVVEPEETTESNKEADKSNPAHTFMLVIFVMTIFIIFKMIFKINRLQEITKNESYEKNALFSLLKDISFMVAVMLIVLIVHFYEGLSSFNTSIDNVLYGMFFFILIWMIFGYIVMKNSFLQIKIFKEYEKYTCDVAKLDELKRVYENQYYNRGNVDANIKAKIDYMQMKQSFVNPIELPTVTESFLRKDFNLAVYFGHCLSDFLCNLFSFGYQAYFIVFLVVISWKLFSLTGTIVQSICMILFPITSLGFLYLQKHTYANIYRNLVSRVESPDNILFQIQNDVRDPFDQYENANFPPYIEPEDRYGDEVESDDGSAPDVEGENEVRSRKKSSSIQNKSEEDLDDSLVLEDTIQRNSNKKNMFKCSESSYGVNHNRHERLFKCGKIGIYLEKLWMQCFFVQMILWIAHLVEYKYLLRDGTEDYYITGVDEVDLVIMLIALLCGIYALLVVFPKVCVQFMIITHIQMMKRRDLIEETIKEQRYERSQRSFRMYQVFKLIRRELIHYFNQDISDRTLRPFTKKLIEENYSLCMLKDSDNIDVLNISEFFPLCGAEMKKLENFILLKKAQSGGQSIKFKDLMKAIEQTTNDVKIDPFEVVKTIFTLVMKDRKKLSITDIKQFFNIYEGYFEREDVEDLLTELVAIQRDGAQINIQEIASLIRDDIECFPR